MRIVVALGGNAIARRGEPLDLATQHRHIARAARAIADLAREHEVVVTHGNGPQVGLLALQAEAAGRGADTPLDVLGAECEGMLGYLIEQELSNLLPGRDVATLLTQVLVRPDDPAFRAPSKPIGPGFDEATARRLGAERGWTMGPDGSDYRRLVPSPMPQRILEMGTLRLLSRLGVLVVCAGGGGIPVVERPDGTVHGVEAVIDKDHSAALLATQLGAAFLLLLTDVPAVYADWPERKQAIRRASSRALSALAFDAGSMGPKVEAACRFAKQTGAVAAIGALEEAGSVLSGESGTRVEAGAGPLLLAEPDPSGLRS